MDPGSTAASPDIERADRFDGTWLVLGLGNPGDDYADTLHNVGFRVLDILAERWKVGGWKREGQAMVSVRTSRAEVGAGVGAEVVLVKPTTYMNRSGRVLSGLFVRYGENSRLLVVSDDVALPVGRLRIREKGSAGGHNGLKSINSAFGSDSYVRVRVGIQTEEYAEGREDTRDYVLSPVPRRDRETLGRLEKLAADAVEAILSEGVRRAMSEFNGMRLSRDGDGEHR
jgi:PTH1 family peptidyl-tRNA hydrolase